jgi:acetyltransferase (GNAT) family protein
VSLTAKLRTATRLVRNDPGELLRALLGRTETMVVFGGNVDVLAPLTPDERLEFRALSEQDLRTLPMPEDFRAEQLDRATRQRASAFGVMCDGTLAHVSWLYDRASEGASPPRYLDLAPHEGEISACVTLPNFRGRGVYGIAIRGIAEVAGANGITRIYMKTTPSNASSQRGIVKAGLAPCGHVTRVFLPLRPSGAGIMLRRFRRS